MNRKEEEKANANAAGEQLWVSSLLDVQEPLPLGNTYFKAGALFSGMKLRRACLAAKILTARLLTLPSGRDPATRQNLPRSHGHPD